MSAPMTHQARAVRASRLSPPLTSLGKRIDALCEARGWSIAALAREIGVHRCTISSVRRGRKPGRDVAKRLDALDAES